MRKKIRGEILQLVRRSSGKGCAGKTDDFSGIDFVPEDDWGGLEEEDGIWQDAGQDLDETVVLDRWIHMNPVRNGTYTGERRLPERRELCGRE